MELEQPISRETSGTVHEINSTSIRNGPSRSTNSTRTVSSALSSDLCNRSESFRTLDIGVPKSISSERRLAWLRSQIIGDDVEFESPFGKRRLTYADHTASGRSLHYIENFIINNVLPFYGNTHTCDSYVGHRTTKMVHEATQYIKRSLGGGEEDAIIFCGSGTTAAIKRLQEVMGIAVPSIMRDRIIKCLSNEERWVVFVGPYEHHSNLLSWRQSLAEVVEIGLNDSGLIDIEALEKLLDSYRKANRPILGSFSASSNVTGIFSKTRGLAQLLHRYGGFVCFDFAASGPYVEIDMRYGEVDGYDAIFLSPHKFLGGPGSPGILLMSKALYQLKYSPPSTCGGGTVCYVNGFNDKDTLYLDDIEERENGGTPQIIQTIRAALAFWVKEYIGYNVIEEQEKNYISKALERVKSNKNIWILGNTSAERQAILSFLIYSTTNSSSSSSKDESSSSSKTGNKRDKPLHGAFVASLLNDLFGIQSRGGCACAGPYGHVLLDISEANSLALRSAIHQGYMGAKPGWTRISFPYYMSNQEFEFIMAAVEFVAIYGQRFLPLYGFNFKTGTWYFKKKAFKDLLVGKENKCNTFPMAAVGGEIINKYASYLEIAKHIANLLPKFPSSRKLPEDLDYNLLYFRV
ncbi:cysteine desulfurylase, putative [Ricinus communis]|uniref:Cysteine desulfurylase, putative n=1 Tax=Ricinus communis TaxID=3988 RepID=B9RU30_RICCO|nr:cysteine desulfurylase, putative [Ricinus communis]